jgi:hypothetical protein
MWVEKIRAILAKKQKNGEIVSLVVRPLHWNDPESAYVSFKLKGHKLHTRWSGDAYDIYELVANFWPFENYHH